MSNPPVMYETVHDGVRATIRREEQGCSILLSPADAPPPVWADKLQLSEQMPAARSALADAESWLRANPLNPNPAPKK